MSDMEKALWELANDATAFAVLQALAFLYALGKTEFAENVRNPVAAAIIYSATCAFTLLYTGAVAVIGFRLVDASGKAAEVWNWVTAGRITTILIFGGLVLLAYRLRTKH